jgi:hypothetical protein
MSFGYIYIIQNKAMPGIVKIGRTGRSPYQRVRELSSVTGVPVPFVLAYASAVPDMQVAEKLIHAYFQKLGYRLSTNREFFAIPVQAAITAIELVKQHQLLQELDIMLEYGFPDEDEDISDVFGENTDFSVSPG